MTLYMDLVVARMIAGNGTQEGGRELYDRALEVAGFPRFEPRPEEPPAFAQVEAIVGRWEDAPAIHDWFLRVSRPARREPDDRERSEVSARQLRELKAICFAVLEDPAQARVLLRGTGAGYEVDLERATVIVDRALSVVGDDAADLTLDDLQRAIEAKDVFFYYDATRE